MIEGRTVWTRCLLVMIMVLLALPGCPVEGKRKKRLARDAVSSRSDAHSECKCPESTEDPARWKAVEKQILEGSPARGGTLRIHTEIDPPNLQPVLRPDAWVVRIVLHDVLQALVIRNPSTNQFEGELAESWTSSEDGLHWTFKLRKGVKWHDGSPFTSADVVNTLSLILAPDSTAVSVKASIEEIVRFEANGDHEVSLELSKPNALFLQHIEGLPILPKHLYVQGNLEDNPANMAPVGTGPFRFGSWSQGKEVVLLRNDGYWGRKAWLDEVRYVIVKDRNVAFQMLKRGDIDMMPRVSADQWAEWDRDDDLQGRFFRVTWTTPDISFAIYNAERTPFDSPAVRRAMTLLLDRERIRCAVHKCLARVISGPFPVGHPANAESVSPYPFDPARADELLAGAGLRDGNADGILDLGGKPLRFSLMVPTQSDAMQRMATIWQEETRRHGLVMDIKLLDWSTYIEKCRSHEFDVAVMSFQMEWDNDLTGIFHSKSVSGGQNFGSWHHDGADYILDRVRVEMDADARNALLQDLHVILSEEQPYTFLFSPLESALISRSFRGLVPGMKWFQEEDAWKVAGAK